MASILSLQTMRASTLTIMATRLQDQELVADVASLHGIGATHGSSLSDDRQVDFTNAKLGAKCKVVPSFGWHPWFSHQLYDDTSSPSTFTAPAESDASPEILEAAKKDHYRAVLSPAPQDDFIASLPMPISLSSFISATKARLRLYRLALVGEIGLDKAFRIPQDWDSAMATSRDDALTPGGREGRRLSPHRVKMQHQQAILLSQLRLAGELDRPVSVHGVQAHGVLFDTVSSCWKGHEKHVPSRREKRRVAAEAEQDTDDEDADTKSVSRPFPPRICLHSYSGPVEGLRQWLRPNVPATLYFSFSTAVNCGTETTNAKLDAVLRAVPSDRILAESDLHTAGEDTDAALERMYRRICHVKDWTLEEGARQIAKNYHEFVCGKSCESQKL